MTMARFQRAIGGLAVFLVSIWIIVGAPTRVFKKCVIAPAQPTTVFSKMTTTNHPGTFPLTTLLKKFYRTQPTNRHKGNTLMKTPYYLRWIS